MFLVLGAELFHLFHSRILRYLGSCFSLLWRVLNDAMKNEKEINFPRSLGQRGDDRYNWVFLTGFLLVREVLSLLHMTIDLMFYWSPFTYSWAYVASRCSPSHHSTTFSKDPSFILSIVKGDLNGPESLRECSYKFFSDSVPQS